MRKLALSLSAVAVLGAVFLLNPAGRLLAQTAGGVIEAARFRLLNSAGNASWRLSVDSSGILNAQNLDTAQTADAAGNGVQVDDLTGAVRIPGYTSTQFATLQSPSTGYIAWCTNCTRATDETQFYGLGRLKISTWTAGGSGSGLGAWTNF